MKWNKMGLIFSPQKTGLPWMVHHAYNPAVIQLEESIWRCFFSGRDTQNIGSAGFFDIDLRKPDSIYNISRDPVLSPGPIGTFDCDGIIPSCVVKVNDLLYMYYIGWNKGWKKPLFRASVGLAISRDGGSTFEKYSKAPIFDRSADNPITVSAPFVYKCGDKYVMNYTSIERWENIDDEFYSWYYTKRAVSTDGIHWSTNGEVVLPLKEGENHIARMAVVTHKGNWEGWYSYTDEKVGQYRIGYAVSSNGLDWIRKDEEAGITLSETGWDSEALAYPYVIVWDNKRFMFYNGNRLGYDGIGLAVEV